MGEREIAIEIGIGFRVQDLESPWDRQTVCGPGGLESLVSLKSLRTDKSGTGLISRFMVMWTFAENGESIAPLCGHSKHLDEGVGNFARER